MRLFLTILMVRSRIIYIGANQLARRLVMTLLVSKRIILIDLYNKYYLLNTKN
jgi:hypothetical protein